MIDKHKGNPAYRAPDAYGLQFTAVTAYVFMSQMRSLPAAELMSVSPEGRSTPEHALTGTCKTRVAKNKKQRHLQHVVQTVKER